MVCKSKPGVWGSKSSNLVAKKHLQVAGFLERENRGLGFGCKGMG